MENLFIKLFSRLTAKPVLSGFWHFFLNYDNVFGTSFLVILCLAFYDTFLSAGANKEFICCDSFRVKIMLRDQLNL